MSIPLPPLPHWNEEMYRQQIRARDQEIVRCVLEAAAKVAEGDPMIGFDRNFAIADAIRALEFKHE